MTQLFLDEFLFVLEDVCHEGRATFKTSAIILLIKISLPRFKRNAIKKQ